MAVLQPTMDEARARAILVRVMFIATSPLRKGAAYASEVIQKGQSSSSAHDARLLRRSSLILQGRASAILRSSSGSVMNAGFLFLYLSFLNISRILPNPS